MKCSDLTKEKLLPLVREGHKRKSSFLEISNGSLKIALVSIDGVNKAREANVDVPDMLPLGYYHQWYYNLKVSNDEKYLVTEDSLRIDELRGFFGDPSYHEIYVKATYEDRVVSPWKFISTLREVDFARIFNDALEFEDGAGKLICVKVQRSCTTLGIFYPPRVIREIKDAGWKIDGNLYLVHPENLTARLNRVYTARLNRISIDNIRIGDGDLWGLLLNTEFNVESLIKNKEIKVLYL